MEQSEAWLVTANLNLLLASTRDYIQPLELTIPPWDGKPSEEYGLTAVPKALAAKEITK